MKHYFKILLSIAGLMQILYSSGQSTTSSNVAGSPAQFLGWDGTGANNKDVDIINRFSNQNINFYTNDGTSTTQKMVIVGSNGADDGFVGIGTTAPAFLLEVQGGDINVNPSTNGYRIGSNYVLWNNGENSNIFVGAGAGSTNFTAANTWVPAGSLKPGFS